MINPMVKAPTLVCDDGEILMDSTLTIAVARRFACFIVPDALDTTGYPGLVAFSARAEALPEFVSTPLE